MQAINNKKFGKFISKIRKEKQMTQKELADKLYVSDKTVSKWECGNAMPNVTLLIPLANTLEVTVTELLQGERSNTNPLEPIIQNEIHNQKKKWKIAYLVTIIILIIEYIIYFSINQKIEIEFLLTQLVMLAVSGWFCLFSKELLPGFYDNNKVNFVSQGVFRIHMPGLSFNNNNWIHILNLLKIFILTITVLFPIDPFLTNIIWWQEIKYPLMVIFLFGFFVSLYIIGKRYE